MFYNGDMDAFVQLNKLSEQMSFEQETAVNSINPLNSNNASTPYLDKTENCPELSLSIQPSSQWKKDQTPKDPAFLSLRKGLLLLSFPSRAGYAPCHLPTRGIRPLIRHASSKRHHRMICACTIGTT